MAAALINPLISVPNSIKTITTGSDIYNIPTNQFDTGLSWISIGLTAVSFELPLIETASEVLDITCGIRAGYLYTKETK